MILMEHPEHGRTHAYTAAQVEENKANGWKVFEESDVKEDIGTLRKKYRDKFGKKPYHGKKAEELIRELSR